MSVSRTDSTELLLEELRRREERLRDFAEAGTDWFFEFDSELRFSYVSESIRNAIGVAPKDLIGRTRAAFFERNLLASESDLFDENLATMMAHKDWKDLTFTFIKDDGEHRILRTSGKAIFDRNGVFAGYRGVGNDVTDQITTQNRMQSLAQIVEDSLNEIYIADAATYRVLDSNKAAQQGLGYTSAELSELFPWDFVQGLSRENIEDLLDPLRDGTTDRQVFEIAHVRKDGSTYPVRTQLQFMQTQGPPVFVALVQDISNVAEAEAQSRQFAQIVENSLNEIYVFDAESLRFTQMNYGARKNIGYAEQEFRNLTPVDIKPEFTLSQFETLIEPLREGREQRLSFESLHQRKDGSTYPIEVSLQLVQSAAGSVFVAFIQDITERQKQSEALKLRDRAIAEVNTGVLITDARQHDNPIVYANKAMERITGYLEEEMLGRNPRFLQSEDTEQPAIERIRSAIEDAVPVHETLLNCSKDGSQYYSEIMISPILDDDGKVSHFISVQSDVTEKLRNEERLRQSQKMEAIGQLTGGIAHDFNNLLTVVLANSELLANRIRDDDFADRLVTDVIAAAESGASLTGQLLSFARQMPLQPKVLDLNNLVREMSGMLSRALSETIEIQTKLAADLGLTLADPGQTQSALLNLAINARDAMPKGGRLTLETSNAVFDDATNAEGYQIEPGEYVLLTISDNGVGMSAELKARVMEPFFTTKELGKGTGLGLSMVHGFANQSGGHLDIYSEPGHGTSVELYLPVAKSHVAEHANEVDETDDHLISSQTVLVVEDDARVRNVTVTRLEELGYRVIEAVDGRQALEVLANSSDIDIVFTDMVMPGGMTGAALLAQVREKYPRIKRMITSGYAEDGAIPNDGTPWLRKPYSLGEMSSVLRDLSTESGR